MSPTLDGICTVSQNVPSGLTVSILLPLLESIDLTNLWELWAPTNKTIGDIPNFTVLNVPIFHPQHNTDYELWLARIKEIQLRKWF